MSHETTLSNHATTGSLGVAILGMRGISNGPRENVRAVLLIALLLTNNSRLNCELCYILSKKMNDNTHPQNSSAY